VPKKVRRGGRYTTGIKRTPSGGYGGQHTSRRGCLDMMLSLAILAGLAVAFVAAGLRPWGA
jgi:pseudouridine-5'-phosphate glycosidase